MLAQDYRAAKHGDISVNLAVDGYWSAEDRNVAGHIAVHGQWPAELRDVSDAFSLLHLYRAAKLCNVIGSRAQQRAQDHRYKREEQKHPPGHGVSCLNRE